MDLEEQIDNSNSNQLESKEKCMESKLLYKIPIEKVRNKKGKIT